MQPTRQNAGQTGGNRGRMWRVLDERLGLGALQYPVPPHANTLGYSLGGITLTSFLILVATGFLLTQYYNPLPEAANESTRYIITTAPLGRLVRGVHYWAAQAMVLAVSLHLIRVFVTAAYKRPREANWLIGVGLLALTFGLYFSGTILKWDQEGYEAMLHNMETARLLGGLGVWFAGEFTRSVPMLVRLYVAHVSILPALLTLFVIAHCALVKRHGISPSPWVPARPAHPESFARHARHLAAYGLVLLGGLLALAVLFPPGLGPTPVEGVEVTKPPLPLLWLYPLENWFGLGSIFYATLLLGVFLVLVPFLDWGPELVPRRRQAMLAAGSLVLAVIVGLIAVALLGPTAAHVGM